MNTILRMKQLSRVASARSCKKRSCKRRRGSAMVEFAIVAPILILLTMGLIQYGLISNATSTLTNLTREGGRYAAVHSDKSDAEIENYIKQVASQTSIGPNDLTTTIEWENPPRTRGNFVKVTIAYDMRKKFFIPASFPGLSSFGSKYSTTGVMMVE